MQGYHTDKARFEEPLARLRQTLNERGHFGTSTIGAGNGPKEVNVVHSSGGFNVVSATNTVAPTQTVEPD